MILAGAARIDITPEFGVPLMGYGARVGGATAIADRIHARALSLESHLHHPILVVSAELCLISSAQANDLRGRIASKTGVPTDAILVACTHTHSGPDTGVADRNAGRPEPAHVAAVFEGMVAAGEEAWRNREPATLAWSETEAHIGRNRRVADGQIDSGLEVLRVVALDGRSIAVLFRHSCHGTVRGHDSLEISGDHLRMDGAIPILDLTIRATKLDPKPTAAGKMGSGNGGGGMGSIESVEELWSIKTTMSAPMDQAVVLGVSPTGNTTSAFVVQVLK